MKVKNDNLISIIKKITSFFILSLITYINPILGADNESVDKLENKLDKIRGTERIEILNHLIVSYSQNDSAKSLKYFFEVVSLSHDLNLNWHESNAYNYLLEGLKNEEAIRRLNTALAFFQVNKYLPGIGYSNSFLGSQYLSMNNYLLAEHFQNIALETFTKIDHPYGIALANERLGVLFMVKNEFLKALDYYYQALKINNKLGYKKEEANSMYHIGLVELYMGNYQESTEYILSSLRYWEQVDFMPNIWNCNELLGNIYIKLNFFKKALHYHRKALTVRLDAIKIYTPKDQQPTPASLLGIAYSYNNIAEVYLNLQQYDSAFYYAKKALEIKTADNSVASKDDIANSWLNMGNIYRKLGKYDSASFMLNKAADTFKALQNGSSYAEALYGIGKFYTDLKKFSKAQEKYEAGLQKSIEVADKNNIKTGYKLLSDLYKTTDNYKKSLDYFLRYSEIKDSIFNKERSNAIEELHIKYEVDKKQQTIESQELIISQKKRQVIFSFAFGSVVLLLAIVVIILVLKNKRQREILLNKVAENLRKDLELKNRELVCNVSNIYTKNLVISKVANTLSHSIGDFKQANMELVRNIIHELKQNMDETSWKEFEYRFSKVHASFYETLDKKFPELTHTERKVCAMLKLEMSSKEIAAITMTLPESIDTIRSRIRKKLGMEKDENLSEFLNKL